MYLNKLTIFIVAALLTLFSTVGSAQEIKEEERTFELDPNGRVFIDTYKGSIEVEAWDKNEVHVYSRIEAEYDGWTSTKPEEQLNNVKVKYDAAKSSLTIQSKYDKYRSNWGSNTRASVHYRIKMPKTAELVIDDYKSDTKVTGLESELKLETYKGRVDVKGLKGSITLETYKGDVTVDIDELKNDSSFETFKGDIDVRLNSEAKFDLDADIGRRGDFNSSFDYSNNLRNRDNMIRGTVNGGGPVLEFETNKGYIRVSKR